MDIIPTVELTEALLDSWDRQCRIVEAVASKVDENNRDVKPSPDGWTLDQQLTHIYGVRRFWLSRFSPAHEAKLQGDMGDDWEPPRADLSTIADELRTSGEAIREAVREGIANGNGPSGGYDNPVLFLQHMIWHEGWHVGLLYLGLRLAGQEPSDEWSEQYVWGEWRTE